MRNLYLILLIILLSACNKTTYVTMLVDDNINNIVVKKLDLVYRNNLFFIDIYVNGIEARLLVDTGANSSILDINQAEKYGFDYNQIDGGTIYGIGGVSNKYNIVNAKVITQTGHLIPIKFKGCDMKMVLNSMSNDGLKVLGIVGSDFLMNSGAIINFETRTLDLFGYLK